jgi:hypothetical protein
MGDLAIATFPLKPAVLSGESLLFRTVLENRGATPLQVPGSDSQSPFTYTFTPRRKDLPGFTVSAQDRNFRRASSPPMPEPAKTGTLEPGKRVERIEDVADFLAEGIAPAKYFVTARFAPAGIVSPKARVNILPPNVDSFSSAITGNSLASAIAHRRRDGGVTLLHRESLRNPHERVFYRFQSLAPGAPVSVATSIDTVPAGAGRWYAWLRGFAVTACLTSGNVAITTSEPFRVGGLQPELLSPGFQIAAGALFGVISSNGNIAQLTTFLANSSGLKPYWIADLTSTGAASERWNYQPDGSLTVVWQEPATGRLLSREFTAEGQPKDSAPRVRTSSRPAAWSVLPSGPLAISVLGVFAGSYRYARLGAQSMADPNPIAELPGVTGWGFVPSANGVKIVAATADGISQIAPGGAWQTVVKTENPQRVNVFTAPNGSPWVEWLQPGYGIRRVRLV